MEKILEQIDGIISGVFYLPKSDATDIRDMVAAQPCAAPDAGAVC